MKTLKFTPELCKQILLGTKTTTWRIFDDKELTQGDKLQFLDSKTKTTIANATITQIQTTTFKELTQSQLVDHQYESISHAIESIQAYYDKKVDLDTEIKIITFKLN